MLPSFLYKLPLYKCRILCYYYNRELWRFFKKSVKKRGYLMLKSTRLLAILLCISLILVSFTACNIADGNVTEDGTTTPFEAETPTENENPTDDGGSGENGETNDTSTNDDGGNVEENTTTTGKDEENEFDFQPDSEISLDDAVAFGQTFSSNRFSSDKYFVRGEVVSIEGSGSSVDIVIKDGKGNTLLLYRTYGKNGADYSSMAVKPKVGDEILVRGVVGQYKGDSEMKDAWIMAINGVNVGEESQGGNQGGNQGGDQGGNQGSDQGGNQGSGDVNTDGLPEDTSGATATYDPYENVSKSQFYANYKPATSYWDAYWRTQHNFMSGTIAEQDQEPTVSPYQPMQSGQYVRNESCIYADNGNTYYVLDAHGNVAFAIYRGGAYIMLEEVAAYIFAFGDIPANYDANKKAKPSSSPWAEYLRVNHNSYSNDVSRYPEEPELPNMYRYYEIDIGTASYNNGSKITRGTCRIVYTRFDKNGNNVIEANERYVFYTYNHYYDFQEYLNYEGGWGEIFGYYTSGNGNPSPYVSTARAYFAVNEANEVEAIVFYYIDTKNLYYAAQI